MYLRKHERVIIRRVKWPLGPFSTEGNLECLPTSQVLPPCFPTPFFSLIEHISRSGKNVHTKNKDNNKWAFFSLLRNPPGILLESPAFTYFDTEVGWGFSLLAQGWIRWTMNHLMIRDLPSAQSRSLKSLKSIAETLRLRPGAAWLHYYKWLRDIIPWDKNWRELARTKQASKQVFGGCSVEAVAVGAW